MCVPNGEVLSMVASLEKHPDVSKVVMLNLSGSKAYGTYLPTSDTDIRGIFVAKPGVVRTPFKKVTELNIPGAEDGKVYELNTFMSLFLDMNPNIIETLFTRDQEILYRTPEFEILRDNAHTFLNSNVAHRFSGYAMSQLKRIRGHDKWINNPQPEKAPSQLEFFRLVQSYLSVPVLKHEDFMRKLNNKVGICSMIPLGSDHFAVVPDHRDNVPPMFNPDGSIRKVVYEEIPDSIKRQPPLFFVKYMREEHKQAKEKHKNYWNWKKNRNATRHELEVKFGYDTKHAMHLVRLMRMAEEILTTGEVNVFREDADELLAIRNGSKTLDEILEWAEGKDEYVRNVLYKSTSLPYNSDKKLAEDVILKVQDMAWKN
ncbi:putative nucleotidyltransferase [Salmonella phage SSBI34]|nr:putative nucleotidyltransferase [Salmonella phage SSBI34]